MPNSYAPEVIADDSDKWCGNELRFATESEAKLWVQDLSMRWILVRKTRVVPSDDPPNYAIKGEGGKLYFASLETPPPPEAA